MIIFFEMSLFHLILFFPKQRLWRIYNSSPLDHKNTFFFLVFKRFFDSCRVEITEKSPPKKDILARFEEDLQLVLEYNSQKHEILVISAVFVVGQFVFNSTQSQLLHCK